MMIDTIVHYISSLIDLDLDSRSQECEKAKTSCANYLTKFSIDLNGMWYSVEAC